MSQQKGCHIPDNWQQYMQQQANQGPPLLRNFYAANTCHTDTTLGDCSLMAMDFETTGLDPENHDIVSIGLIPFDMQRIYCRRAKHLLVRPAGKLEELSISFHGITHSQLQDAPEFGAVLESLLHYLEGKVVVVHYHQIERYFLWQHVMRAQGIELLFPVIDTMRIEEQILQQQRKWWHLRTRGHSLRLADCRTRYHLPHYTLHHALTDALATAELFQAQVQHHYSAQTKLGELWC